MSSQSDKNIKRKKSSLFKSKHSDDLKPRGLRSGRTNRGKSNKKTTTQTTQRENPLLSSMPSSSVLQHMITPRTEADHEKSLQNERERIERKNKAHLDKEQIFKGLREQGLM